MSILDMEHDNTGHAAHMGSTLSPDIPAPPRLPSASDRRSAPRHVFETKVDFSSDSNFYTGFAEDISEGGLFVATWELKPLGSPMDIEFELPDGHIVHARGVVRWLRDPRDDHPDAPPGMGVQFESLDPLDKEAIQMFLGIRSPLFYDD
ncbi:MAG: TIGR02266 family protein [Deltaproteobacteria bacterium]|nr:TIGR02266 family protein [Deltaproteobacteria bacterium]